MLKTTVCNIKIDKDNYKKDRNICKNCYNMNRKNIIITPSLEMILKDKTIEILLPTNNQELKTLITTIITKTEH